MRKNQLIHIRFLVKQYERVQNQMLDRARGDWNYEELKAAVLFLRQFEKEMLEDLARENPEVDKSWML